MLMTEAICSYSRGGEVGGRGEVIRMIIVGYENVLMFMMMSRVGEERTLVWNLLTVLEGPEVSFTLIIILIW